ncbi:MAG: DUF4345 family protein [Hyphomicrobiaceae bacterium]|nr:DUF4345 family protein [Hyphomicrobiaceae bacterium]MCC0011346.1 DUF4345 family protein [Hyphomicrobiaceae bacterium]
MLTFTRLIVGLIAVLMAFVGLGLWFALDQTAPLLGLTPDPVLARSSIRADNGTLFLTLSGLAAYAAIKLDRTAAMLCATMFLIAFSGRFLTMVIDGGIAETMMPMLLEGGSAVILFAAARSWNHEHAT